MSLFETEDEWDEDWYEQLTNEYEDKIEKDMQDREDSGYEDKTDDEWLKYKQDRQDERDGKHR